LGLGIDRDRADAADGVAFVEEVGPDDFPVGFSDDPQIAGCGMNMPISCAVASGTGKSRGNRWWSETATLKRWSAAKNMVR
jgi:hypothetical protein